MIDEHIKEFIELLLNLDNENSIELRNKIYFLTLIRFGLRASEGLDLNITSFSFSAKTIYLKVIGKGNKERIIPLPLQDDQHNPIEKFVEFKNLIEDYINCKRQEVKNIKDDKALFISQKSSRLSYAAINKIFNIYMKKLGLKGLGYSPHSLRHGMATRLLYEGVPLKEVSEIMGHKSSLVTASVYEHTELKKMRKGMEKSN